MSWTSSKMRCTLKKFYGGSPIKGNHETLKISSPLEVKNPKRTFIHPHSDQQGLLWDKLPLFLYPAPWANKTLWMWMKILISLPQGGRDADLDEAFFKDLEENEDIQHVIYLYVNWFFTYSLLLSIIYIM